MVNFTCGTNRVIIATCIHISSARLFTWHSRILDLNIDDAFLIKLMFSDARIADKYYERLKTKENFI